MKDRSPYGPLHASGPSHRKVFELAGKLGIEPAHAFGLLCSLWARALTEARDGQVFGGAKRLASLAGWHGKPAVFLDAMVAVGAIDRDGELLFIHDWINYGGHSIAVVETKIENGKKGGRPPNPKPTGSENPKPVGYENVEPVPLLSLSDQGSEEIARVVPVNRGRQAGDAPRPRVGRIGYSGVGFMVNPADFPQTPEALLEQHRDDFANVESILNGKGSAPALLDAIRSKWTWYLTVRDRPGGGHTNALAALKVDVGKIAKGHEGYSRNKPSPHEHDINDILSRQPKGSW